MNEKSIILVGGPDSGKSNYLARLWLALQSRKHNLISTTPPDDIKYIEELASHLLQGSFAPRTEPEDKRRDFNVSVTSINSELKAQIIVPDINGEIWRKAVKTFEIPKKWLETLKSANGAILFIRIQSPNNVESLDWIASRELLKAGFSNPASDELPTQVSLIEMVRFIDENILRSSKELPKLAVVITAWDLLNAEEQAETPFVYLEKQFPMFAGRIKDIKSLNVRLFGCSIVGGDFMQEDFKKTFLEGDIADFGYIISDNGACLMSRVIDTTEPIKWLLSE